MKKYRFLGWFIVLLALCCGGRFGLLIRPKASFPLRLKWQTDLGLATYERPAYQDGLLLFPANSLLSSHWYGLEAATGQVVWAQRIRRNSFRRCLTSEYLVVSGLKSLLVLKTRTGDIVWEGDNADTATCSDTTVFTVVPRSFVQAQDLVTGQYRWRGINPYKPVLGVIYNPERDELIAGGAFIVDPHSGHILRSFEPSPQQISPPVERRRGPMYLIDQGQLFIGGTVLDAKTGQVLHLENRYGGLAAPTVTKDAIYIADSTESIGASGVVALDRTTYAIKWKYQPQHKLPLLPLNTVSPMEVLEGIGYVIFSDATLRAIDLETGQELGYWQLGVLDLLTWPVCDVTLVPGCVEATGVGMTTSQDTLFVSFGNGKLYAFGKGPS